MSSGKGEKVENFLAESGARLQGGRDRVWQFVHRRGGILVARKGERAVGSFSGGSRAGLLRPAAQPQFMRPAILPYQVHSGPAGRKAQEWGQARTAVCRGRWRSAPMLCPARLRQ